MHRALAGSGSNLGSEISRIMLIVMTFSGHFFDHCAKWKKVGGSSGFFHFGVLPKKSEFSKIKKTPLCDKLATYRKGKKKLLKKSIFENVGKIIFMRFYQALR